MTNLIRSLVASALLLLTFSCSSSIEDAQFVRRDKAEFGVYTFSLDFADSLSHYDLWIYGRASKKDLSDIQLKAEWIDPLGEEESEIVYMRTLSRKGSKELYRSGISSVSGQWTLKLCPIFEDQSQIDGLGIILQNGTR